MRPLEARATSLGASTELNLAGERPLALITGASAGIGREIATQFAAHGYDLALVSRRRERLLDVAAVLADCYEVDALVIDADLSSRDGPSEVLSRLRALDRHVDALVNSAGYFLPNPFEAAPWDEHLRFVQLMMLSVCELTHACLSGMKQRGFGQILNVASLAGLLPGAPGHAFYFAAKSFLVSFSRSLHMEARGTGVQVTALCPGLTKSEFFDANGTREHFVRNTPTWAWQTSAEVARAGYDALFSGRVVCAPGLVNQAVATAFRLFPDAVALAIASEVAKRLQKPGTQLAWAKP